MFKANLETCADVKSVTDALEKTMKFEQDFLSQPDWQQKIQQNILDHSHDITGFQQQMLDAWDAGKFYQAGQLAGLIDAYMFGKL